MSGWQLAALVGGVAVVVVFVALLARLLAGVVRLERATRELGLEVEEVRRQTSPLAGELRAALGSANGDAADGSNGLVPADSNPGDVPAARRPAYAAFAHPVIKARALGTGTGRAARRFRQRRER